MSISPENKKDIKRLNAKVEIENDILVIYDDEGEFYQYRRGDKQGIQEAIFHEKKTLIENCLFGVDINPNSAHICRLRLWIELLKHTHYLTTNKDDHEMAILPNIDINIKTGNSLISQFKVEVGQAIMIDKKLRKEWVEKYRNAVNQYKNTAGKASKKEIEKIIKTMKGSFRSEGITSLLGDDPIKTKREIEKDELYKNSMEWMLEFPEVLDDDARFLGFDVVIGNPPYGFRGIMSKEMKEFFRKKEKISFPSGDIAELFVIKSSNLVKENGKLGFIIPKKSLYGESWKETRGVWLKNNLFFLVDVTKAFPIVLLEQVLFGFDKKQNQKSTLKIGILHEKGESDIRETTLEKIYDNEKDNFKLYVPFYEESLLEKIKNKSRKKHVLGGSIGISNITSFMTDKEDGYSYPIIKGKQLKRYHLEYPLYVPTDAITKEDAKYYTAKTPKLVAQEIIAHITKPVPHIKIAIHYDNKGMLLHDTAVEINVSENVNKKFILGYLQSSFVNWYAYNLIYNRAIRTMHFINYYVQQIPIPTPTKEQEKQMVALVDQMLANPNDKETDKKIDALVYQLYGLTEEEIKIIEGEK